MAAGCKDKGAMSQRSCKSPAQRQRKKAASSRRTPKPLHDRFVVVFNLDSVDLETVDRLHLGATSRTFKPCGRTPAVISGPSDQAVFNGILMHVIQARKIGFLKRQLRIPKVEPHTPACCAVEAINCIRRFSVEAGKK